ncbi:MAG: 30S ribosomal protein S8 [Candidatus Omnitrophota bacterium]|nr:30S ribosomal protein S8 [Candidatus Omnitrophota bacterium]
MNRTYPVADVLTMIRNANRVGKEKVDVPASKIIDAVLSILKKEGYIEDFKLLGETNSKSIRVYLRFDNNVPVISGLRCVSKPSLRVYSGKEKLPKVLSGQGIAIISTSKGVVTDKEARDLKVGGEVICYVW